MILILIQAHIRIIQISKNKMPILNQVYYSIIMISKSLIFNYNNNNNM